MSEITNKVTFLVNLCDKEGDIITPGVFLCFEECEAMIKVADSPKEFADFEKVIKQIAQEIRENYSASGERQ